ncbi:lipopolysaccharide assembly protein LapA domain-containing protein [Lysobacter sp. A3-1-A15]|uniref:lipopolysaccharide assembly protein LapA domain-containing protein n=1 Tax=Novilysobacter viscosus TaxID=3098602 RepID=UPI002EDA6CB0
MRLIRILVAFACLATGAIVGALNRDLVQIDFGVLVIATTLGIALIVSLLLGVLIGGLSVSAAVVLPLRRRLSRVERAHHAAVESSALAQTRPEA